MRAASSEQYVARAVARRRRFRRRHLYLRFRALHKSRRRPQNARFVSARRARTRVCRPLARPLVRSPACLQLMRRRQRARARARRCQAASEQTTRAHT